METVIFLGSRNMVFCNASYVSLSSPQISSSSVITFVV